MKLLSHDRTFVGDEFIAQLNVLVFFAAIQYIGVFVTVLFPVSCLVKQPWLVSCWLIP